MDACTNLAANIHNGNLNFLSSMEVLKLDEVAPLVTDSPRTRSTHLLTLTFLVLIEPFQIHWVLAVWTDEYKPT
jgi:hypothetical protein